MNRTLKTALLASAAVFVLGTAVPSLAQQESTRAASTQRQRVVQPVQPDRNVAVREYDTAADSSDAYAYQPAGPSESCTTEGSYGQGIDYGACNGGD